MGRSHIPCRTSVNDERKQVMVFVLFILTLVMLYCDTIGAIATAIMLWAYVYRDVQLSIQIIQYQEHKNGRI